MSRFRSFVRREPVLAVSVLAAAVSCFFVRPDAGYAEYIDFRTLALLYCLMAVVAGLRKAGLFESLAHAVCIHVKSTRVIGVTLVCLCFFSSMLITNDVALLTFVPFAVVVLGMAGRERDLIYIVVLQTVAANLGSMLTPVGNPQNLYLYSRYSMSMADFFSVTLPVWLVSLILLLLLCLPLSRSPIHVFLGEEPGLNKKALWGYCALFVLCLLTVLRLLTWQLMLISVVLALLLFDRRTLAEPDFMLLLTFVAFFIFAGNLGRIDRLRALLQSLLSGREFSVSLLASQVISNVPAALLLSGFTGQVRPLLLGVNIGGLGTPIASLASLISLKLYSHSENASTGRFLLVFTGVNLLMLAVLSVLQSLL